MYLISLIHRSLEYEIIAILRSIIFLHLCSVWLHFTGPPELTLTGLDIRRFIIPAMVTLEMADAIVQLFRSLEYVAMVKRTKSAGRHYVRPQWGVRYVHSSSLSIDLCCAYNFIPIDITKNIL